MSGSLLRELQTRVLPAVIELRKLGWYLMGPAHGAGLVVMREWPQAMAVDLLAVVTPDVVHGRRYLFGPDGQRYGCPWRETGTWEDMLGQVLALDPPERVGWGGP